MNEKRKLKWDSGNAFNETHTVCVILIPKHVVTKETNIFAAMCKVTCLRIIECGLTISVYVCVCICMCVCMANISTSELIYRFTIKEIDTFNVM